MSPKRLVTPSTWMSTSTATLLPFLQWFRVRPFRVISSITMDDRSDVTPSWLTERHAEPRRCARVAGRPACAARGGDGRGGVRAALGARDRDARPGRPFEGRRARADDGPGCGRRPGAPARMDRLADRSGHGRFGRGTGLKLACRAWSAGRRVHGGGGAGRRL